MTSLTELNEVPAAPGAAAATPEAPILVSLGIMAWNEERSIGDMLESLFRQSLFAKLRARNVRAEILCLANGCTDRTAAVAGEFFARMQATHPDAAGFTTRVCDLVRPGRNATWNRFVHELSATGAQYIFLMDADITFQRENTLYNMVTTLERNPHARVSSDRQCKDILFKSHRSVRERISLATSDMTDTIEGRFSGQLYCMRATTARNLYLPRDLSANDDGFFKAVICTSCFTEPLDPSRIVTAPNAAHLYKPYLEIKEIMDNQKRQMIGQAGVYVLVEYLKRLPLAERANLAETLRRHEQCDPDWLRFLIGQHLLHSRYFWRLFPGILTFRFRRCWKMSGFRKLTHFPAAVAGFVVTLIACWRAHRHLRNGHTQYWPQLARQIGPVATPADAR